MRDAATSLIDLQVLGIASEDTKDHQIYGVIEPDKQKLEASQEGVGLLVEFQRCQGQGPRQPHHRQTRQGNRGPELRPQAG